MLWWVLDKLPSPSVASVLQQSRAYQPYASASGFSRFGFGMPGSSGWQGSQ